MHLQNSMVYHSTKFQTIRHTASFLILWRQVVAPIPFGTGKSRQLNSSHPTEFQEYSNIDS